jgi:hypothetical protein
VQRKASIAQELKKLCEAEGIGLYFKEIDTLIGGSEHDLLDRESQEAILAEIGAGDFDIVILSPPCGSWSRANYSEKPGPKPVRSRAHPWGLPGLKFGQLRRMENGNEFIHFAIRAIATAQGCKRRGRRVCTILEHPEDLGRVPKGVPASIWQLPNLRAAFAEFPYVTAAGYQCQFEAWTGPSRRAC